MMDIMNNLFARASVCDMVVLIELHHLQLESGSGLHLLGAVSGTWAMHLPQAVLDNSSAELMAKSQMKFEVSKAKVVPLAVQRR